MQSFETSKNVFMGLMNMYTQWKWIVIYFVESDYYIKRWSEKNTKQIDMQCANAKQVNPAIWCFSCNQTDFTI